MSEHSAPGIARSSENYDYQQRNDAYASFDAERTARLVQRLRRATQACKAVKDEINDIRNQACAIGMPWHPALESIMAHTEIDFKYLEQELRQLIGE